MRLRPITTLISFFFITAVAARSGTLITFEGLSDRSLIDDFYNGGAGGSLGISFNDRFRALIDSDVGGTGVFGGEPSPSTVAVISPGSGSSAIINVPAGFETSFSLSYSGPGNTVLVFNAPNAQGAVIGFGVLSATPSSDVFVTTTVTDFRSPGPIAVSIAARSVLFGFVGFGAQQTLVDNLEFGPAVPEPSALVLIASGLCGLAVFRRCTARGMPASTPPTVTPASSNSSDF
ncbi:MAG: hypothetical protein QOJ99_5520 [Bryobacterales bacterium]|jgi:hypothetical protein|nr:hypothetical protein [Bryobacterales bacterium]